MHRVDIDRGSTDSVSVLIAGGELDAYAAPDLRAALAPSIADAAVVIVAQRVSSIRHAHQILVLEDAHLVGAGTHDDLLATCDTYAEIVASQHAGVAA